MTRGELHPKDRLASKLVGSSAVVGLLALAGAGVAAWIGTHSLHSPVLPMFIVASVSTGLFGVSLGLAAASVAVDRLPVSHALNATPIVADAAPTLIFRQVQPATRTDKHGRN